MLSALTSFYETIYIYLGTTTSKKLVWSSLTQLIRLTQYYHNIITPEDIISLKIYVLKLSTLFGTN